MMNQKMAKVIVIILIGAMVGTTVVFAMMLSQKMTARRKMMKKGFDANKYIEEQSKYILERINQGNSDRLYLEFGGKLVHDKHAMRVLPGFDENAKIKLLQKLKDQAEIIICIYSGDIMTSKTNRYVQKI